jgi:sulfatase maturation enzyme AslB (radical SAM superfamily)
MYINILLGTKCNMKCDYCYLDIFNDKRYLIELDAKKLESEINKLCDTRKLTKFTLGFLGGEPFMYLTDIKRILSLFKDRVSQVVVATNGTMLNQMIDLIETFPDISFQIVFSIDGYLSFHRGKNHNDKILNNLLILSNRKNDNLRIAINSVISKDSIGDFYDLVKWIKEKGLVGKISIKFSPNFAEINDFSYFKNLFTVKEFNILSWLLMKSNSNKNVTYKNNAIMTLFLSKNKRRKYSHQNEYLCDISYEQVVTFTASGYRIACEGTPLDIDYTMGNKFSGWKHIKKMCNECDTKPFCKVCPLAYQITDNDSTECYPNHHFAKIHTLLYINSCYIGLA